MLVLSTTVIPHCYVWFNQSLFGSIGVFQASTAVKKPTGLLQFLIPTGRNSCPQLTIPPLKRSAHSHSADGGTNNSNSATKTDPKTISNAEKAELIIKAVKAIRAEEEAEKNLNA